MNEEVLATWSPDSLVKELTEGFYTGESFAEADPRKVAKFEPKSEVHEVLLRLFLSGEKCATPAAKKALPISHANLTTLGLLVEEGGQTRSRFRIMPCPEGYCAEDFPSRLHTSPDDFTMGVAPTTRMVRRLIPDIEPETVLDLCCGGGWLAITQALKGHQVTGCDLNSRALQIARLNARFLKAPPIDWQQGPWFEPVANRTFDLIIANPPFVQSPGSASIALDTPAEESAAEILLPQLANYLNPGGFACMLLDWQFANPDTWQKIPSDLFPKSGVQSLLFEVQRHSPTEYAEHWLSQDPRFSEPSARTKEAARWINNFSKRGTTGVSSGFVVLRKCEPGQEFHFSDSRGITHFAPESSAEIGRFFRNQEWLQLQSADLLDAIFDKVPGIRKTEGSVLGEDGWDVEELKLTSPAKLLYDGHIDPALLLILETAAEGKPVRSILPTLAEMVGSQPDAIAPQVRELLKELVTRTLLAPKTAA